jgi:hypothetical protein
MDAVRISRFPTRELEILHRKKGTTGNMEAKGRSINAHKG